MHTTFFTAVLAANVRTQGLEKDSDQLIVEHHELRTTLGTIQTQQAEDSRSVHTSVSVPFTNMIITNTVDEKLHTVNEGLKKFAHVNKSFEQYKR